MGLKCKIHKDSQGAIVLVEAPNGDNSNLYQDALNYTSDQQSALDIWSVAYSNRFKEAFGDFETGDSYIDLDVNGEPVLSSVLDFVYLQKSSNKRLSNKDISVLNNISIGMDIDSFDSLYQTLIDTFFINGRFVVNTTRLKSSGLYSDTEISNIANSPELQNRILNFMYRIQGENMIDNMSETKLDPNFVSFDSSEELIVFDTNNVNDLGFYEKVNPNHVYNDIAYKVAGITNRSDFDAAFMNVSYESVVDRYLEDPEFADYVFNKYSKIDAISIMDVIQSTPGNIVLKSNGSINTIFRYFTPDETDISESSDIIDNLLSMDSNTWNNNKSNIKTLLKGIERRGVSMGIDVIGLSDMYDTRSMDDILNFLGEFDIFLNGEVRDFEAFSQAYNTFFNIDSSNITEIVSLPDNLKGLSLVSLRDGIINKANLYADYGLIQVSDNLYHKVDNSITKDELYTTLYTLSLDNPNIMPSEAFYPAAFKNGVLDTKRLVDISRTPEVLRSIKQYVSKVMVQDGQYLNNHEEVVLNRIIFGYSSPILNDVNPEVEFSKFSSFNGNENDILYSFPNRFYNYVLNEKLKNSEVYNSILSNFRFDGNNISLRNSDPMTMKEIELFFPEGKILNDLKNYVYLSSDSSFNGLFENFGPQTGTNSMRSKTFLYVNNPQLLPNFTGTYSTNSENDYVEVKNEFSDFLKINGIVYSKIGESDEYSYYQIAGFKPMLNMKNMDLVSPIFENFGGKNVFSDFGRYSLNEGSDSFRSKNLYSSSEKDSLKKKMEC